MKRLFTPIFAAILSLTAASLTTSCGPSAPADPFTRTEDLAASDSIAIDQILRPREWVAAGDKAVITTSSKDSSIYVYSLPDFRYLYSGLRAGGGPDEIANIYTSILRSYPDGTFVIEDYGTKTMVLKAGEQGIEPVYYIRSADRKAAGGGFDADSLYLDADYGNDFQEGNMAGWLLLQDFRGRTADSTASQSFLHTVTSGSGTMSIGRNWPNAALCGNTVALVFYETGRTEFYDISQGRLTLKAATGDDTPVEKLMKNKFAQYGMKYPNIVCDGRHFCVLANEYIDCSPDRPQVVSHLLVYTPDGKPVKKVRTDKPATNLLFYQGKLFTIDGTSDFDRVYVYELNI